MLAHKQIKKNQEKLQRIEKNVLENTLQYQIRTIQYVRDLRTMFLIGLSAFMKDFSRLEVVCLGGLTSSLFWTAA